MEPDVKTFKIVLIGAGNVATHLAKRLQKKGHEILQIVSKSEKNARELSLEINTPFVTDFKKINTQADVYILCIPDDAIEKVAQKLKLNKKLVLHTSGSVGLSALKKVSSNIGVLYPLQTFSKKVKISFSNIPLLIEANNKSSLQALKLLADSLSKNVNEVSSKDRLNLHLAATMVNNFTNYLFVMAFDFLSKEKNDSFHLLMPLIKQTVKKVKNHHPDEVQTGPAKRGDTNTIKKHVQLLKKYPEQKKIYELFTALIKKQTNG